MPWQMLLYPLHTRVCHKNKNSPAGTGRSVPLHMHVKPMRCNHALLVGSAAADRPVLPNIQQLRAIFSYVNSGERQLGTRTA
jgi:hypothetical protein